MSAADDVRVHPVVTLERLRVAAHSRVGEAVLASMRLDSGLDPFSRGLAYTLTAEVLAQKLADETVMDRQRMTVMYPDSPWQMFKNNHDVSWWLRWLVRRRPVRWHTQERAVTLHARWTGYAKFPQASIVVADDRLGRPVYFSQVETFTYVEDSP